LAKELGYEPVTIRDVLKEPQLLKTLGFSGQTSTIIRGMLSVLKKEGSGDLA